MKQILFIILWLALLIQNVLLYTCERVPCSAYFSQLHSEVDCNRTFHDMRESTYHRIPYQRAAAWRNLLNSRQKSIGYSDADCSSSQRFCEEYLPKAKYCKYISRDQLYRYLLRACHGNITRYRVHLLHLHDYYSCLSFIKIIQTFPEYSDYITTLYRKEKQANWFTRAWHSVTGFTDTISCLYKSVQHQKKRAIQQEKQKQSIVISKKQNKEQHKTPCQNKQQQKVAEVFTVSYPLIEYAITHAPCSTDDAYNSRLIARANALARYSSGDRNYYEQCYMLDQATRDFLQKWNDIPLHTYSMCYGNILQHTLHQECLSILQATAQLDSDVWLYDYQESLVGCADSARIYNQAGNADKSMAVLDWCAALLSYGKTVLTAVAEGAVNGIIDIFSNPVQLGIAVLAPEYMLAYQLAHVLYRVADIGIMYLIDLHEAKEKIDQWLDPLIAIIDYVQNREISLKNMVRMGTRVAVGVIAQNKLLYGIKGFCTITRSKLKYGKGKNWEKCNAPTATPIDNSIPRFIRAKCVPKDKETILQSDEFIKMGNREVLGAQVYKNKKNNQYYHRDTKHIGKSAHIEVYNIRGDHLGKADPITGCIIPGTKCKGRKLPL